MKFIVGRGFLSLHALFAESIIAHLNDKEKKDFYLSNDNFVLSLAENLQERGMPMLDFRVETFLAVCRHMNFTKAARELNITQPAVSHHMHYLEQAYGTALFQHNGKRLQLTEAGGDSAPHADDDEARRAAPAKAHAAGRLRHARLFVRRDALGRGVHDQRGARPVSAPAPGQPHSDAGGGYEGAAEQARFR